MTARKIPSDLAGLRFVEEASFSVDPGSGYVRLPCASAISFKPEISMHEAMCQKSEDQRGPDADVVGAKGGTLSFDAALYTEGGGEAQVMKLMKNCGMQQTTISSTNITGSSAANKFYVLDADKGNLDGGVAVLHKPASGTASIRFVTGISPIFATSEYTVNADFATAPSAGDDLMPIDTVIPDPDSRDPAKTMTFEVYQGSGTTDRLKWTLTGCAGKWNLASVDADGTPIIHFEFSVDSWADSESNLSYTSKTGNATRPVLGDVLLVDGSEVETKSVEYDPGHAPTAVPAVSGSNGRSGWTYGLAVPKAVITPLHDTAWITKFEDGTTFDLEFESLTSATDAWAFWIHECQVGSYDLSDADGILRAGMDFKATDAGSTSGGGTTTKLPMTAFAISR